MTFMISLMITAGQINSTSDIDKNYLQCKDLVEKAASEGVKLLCLPECFDFIGLPGEALKMAEPLDGPLMSRYRQLAVDNRIWLSLGGFHESGPDSSRLRNTHCIVNDQGTLWSFCVPNVSRQHCCRISQNTHV